MSDQYSSLRARLLRQLDERGRCDLDGVKRAGELRLLLRDAYRGGWKPANAQRINTRDPERLYFDAAARSARDPQSLLKPEPVDPFRNHETAPVPAATVAPSVTSNVTPPNGLDTAACSAPPLFASPLKTPPRAWEGLYRAAITLPSSGRKRGGPAGRSLCTTLTQDDEWTDEADESDEEEQEEDDAEQDSDPEARHKDGKASRLPSEGERRSGQQTQRRHFKLSRPNAIVVAGGSGNATPALIGGEEGTILGASPWLMFDSPLATTSAANAKPTAAAGRSHDDRNDDEGVDVSLEAGTASSGFYFSQGKPSVWPSDGGAVTSVAFSATSSMLAAGCASGVVLLFSTLPAMAPSATKVGSSSAPDFPFSLVTRLRGHVAAVMDLCWQASATNDLPLRASSAAGPPSLASTVTSLSEASSSVAATKDSGSAGEREARAASHVSTATAAAAGASTPAIALLLSCALDGCVIAWDAARATRLRHIATQFQPLAIRLIPTNMNYFLLGLRGGTSSVRLYSLSTGTCVRKFRSTESTGALAVSPDGLLAATGDAAGKVTLLSLDISRGSGNVATKSVASVATTAGQRPVTCVLWVPLQRGSRDDSAAAADAAGGGASLHAGAAPSSSSHSRTVSSASLVSPFPPHTRDFSSYGALLVANTRDNALVLIGVSRYRGDDGGAVGPDSTSDGAGGAADTKSWSSSRSDLPHAQQQQPQQRSNPHLSSAVGIGIRPQADRDAGVTFASAQDGFPSRDLLPATASGVATAATNWRWPPRLTVLRRIQVPHAVTNIRSCLGPLGGGVRSSVVGVGGSGSGSANNNAVVVTTATEAAAIRVVRFSPEQEPMVLAECPVPASAVGEALGVAWDTRGTFLVAGTAGGSLLCWRRGSSATEAALAKASQKNNPLEAGNSAGFPHHQAEDVSSESTWAFQKTNRREQRGDPDKSDRASASGSNSGSADSSRRSQGAEATSDGSRSGDDSGGGDVVPSGQQRRLRT